MGMSTHVRGFIPPDETWAKMKAVWDACMDAGIPVPGAVEDFFEDGEPDNAGMEVELPKARGYRADMREGIEIDVRDIPPKVKTIRFWNSW